MLAVGIGAGGKLLLLPLEVRERTAMLRFQQQWELGFLCPASVGAENVPDETQENWVGRAFAIDKLSDFGQMLFPPGVRSSGPAVTLVFLPEHQREE